MTKKDYIKIANVIRGAVIRENLSPAIESLISDFCKMLKNDNIKFNEEKFLNHIVGKGGK